MRRKRIRKVDLVILWVVVVVTIAFDRWIRSGPWFLSVAVFIVGGVIAVYIVAFRAQARLTESQRDPDERPCPKCEYDLRGNSSGRCPECGTQVESTTRS